MRANATGMLANATDGLDGAICAGLGWAARMVGLRCTQNTRWVRKAQYGRTDGDSNGDRNGDRNGDTL